MLNVNLRTTDDWFRLLDGRFSQLKSLSVVTDLIDTPSLSIDNPNIVSNLTSFVLVSAMPTEEYDHFILSLLRKMSNLLRAYQK
ncbi:unnamed protein product [Rotaria magnacalcarata]